MTTSSRQLLRHTLLTNADVGQELTVEVRWFDKYRNGDDEAEVLTTFTVLDPVIYNQPKPFIIVGDLVDGRLTTGVELTALIRREWLMMVYSCQAATPMSGRGAMR